MTDIYSVIAQLFIDWLIADLISGVIHWFEDRLFWVGMPLISELVVVPNRLHHVDPLAFTLSSAVTRSWTVWLAMVPIVAVWLWVFGFSWIFLGAVLGGGVVNEVHALAHRNDATGLLRALQQTGIIQSPGHHARHHRGGMNTHYCILTDWLNPLIDLMRLWERLENGLTRIGLEPNRGTK